MSFLRAKAALAATRFADLRWVASTGSTNRDMLDLLAAPSGDPSRPVVLIADHQVAGRGRLDRTWVAPPGASVLMTVGLPTGGLLPERRTLLTSALALAVAGAPTVRGALRLKWPNDLVAQGAAPGGGDLKVGGLLAELHQVPGRGECVLLGIGVNVNWVTVGNDGDVPAEVATVAGSLDRLLGTEVDREDLVAEALTALDQRWLPVLEDRAAPPTELLDAYRAASATIGRQVRVELPSAELYGTATDVTATGELVVVDDQRVARTVAVGDVVHLRPVD